MKELEMQNGEVIHVAGRDALTAEDINECWCCGTPTERPSLCTICDDAGCNRFTDDCDAEGTDAD